MEIYIYSAISVILVSVLSLVGLFTLSLKEELLRKYVLIFVSLAVGALLGDAFIHLIPEAFVKINNTTFISLGIIIGIFIFFILEKVLHWHHHHEFGDEHFCQAGHLILISDGVHNFIDGLIIGASYLVSIELGIATTLAVVLHEIPQEIGDFGVLLHSGYTASKALWLNFLSALFSLGGLAVAFLASGATATFALWLTPVAAGGFIYIAMSDLIPELHKTKNLKSSFAQLVAIAVGIGAMISLLLIEA